VRRATVLLVAETRRNRRRRINREAPILTWRISQRTKKYKNKRERYLGGEGKPVVRENVQNGENVTFVTRFVYLRRGYGIRFVKIVEVSEING